MTVIALLGCAEPGPVEGRPTSPWTTLPPTEPTDPPDPPDPPEPDRVELGAWEVCDRVPGTGVGGAECAVASVPLAWSDPEGPTYDLLVKRIPAASTPTTQLWILHGGPGASAVDDLDLLSYGLPELRDGLEVYAVDHRGIGGSGRLGCGAEQDGVVTEAEWPGCLEEAQAAAGPAWDHLTTTESARDVAGLIAHLREDRAVFVWGGSYGTYLAQRYLALDPDPPPDGVVLEGIQHPARDFVGYDADLDRVARDLFALCAADPACGPRFGGDDPWGVVEATVDALDHGHCAASGLGSDDARGLLAWLEFYAPIRDLLPAVVHRLDRCAPEDVDAIAALYGAIGGLGATLPLTRPGVASLPGNDGLGASNLLFFHVALSEMWYPADEAPSVADATAAWRELAVSSGLETWLAARSPTWPRYPADVHDDRVPSYAGPLLMLQGGLDAPTPWDRAAPLAEVYTGPSQTWALFPYGAHGVVGSSPTPAGDCGLDVYLQFLDRPEVPPDLGCVADVPPPDFAGDPFVSTWLLGTADAWGD